MNSVEPQEEEQLRQKRRWYVGVIVSALIALIGALGAGWYIYEEEVLEVRITLPENQNRGVLAAEFGDALDWADAERETFVNTFAQLQWEKLASTTRAYLSDTYDWRDAEQEVFSENNDTFRGADTYDLIEVVYQDGAYTFKKGATPETVAQEVVSRTNTDTEFFRQHVQKIRAGNIERFVSEEVEKTPDIVPLPPQDVAIRNKDEGDMLVFSTTYFNQGAGPLELVSSAGTTSSAGDAEYTVTQHIQRTDGGVQTEQVGTFEWHEEHLHYHFNDFVDYSLTAVATTSDADVATRQTKATFCVRDVSQVEIDNPNVAEDAMFRICNKGRQGVSVGWGDTYFHNYPDQDISVEGLSAGRYWLAFEANPDRRFREDIYENNISRALLELDPAAGTVEVIRTEPSEYPDVEHVYPDQPFGKESMKK